MQWLRYQTEPRGTKTDPTTIAHVIPQENNRAIFRRTTTVTGNVQFLEGPWQLPGMLKNGTLPKNKFCQYFWKISMFLKKRKKLTPTLLYCAHSQTNRLFKLLDVQNPKMSLANLQGLAKRFLHVQNPNMSFGNMQGLSKRFLKTTLFHGPKAPGAHRAHILLLKSSYFRLRRRTFFVSGFLGGPQIKKRSF